MKLGVLLIFLGAALQAMKAAPTDRPRLRDSGLRTGVLTPGPLNAITDVAGVKVGHTTIIQGQSVRTGVTAILPHEDNVFQDKVAGAVAVANGFGKLIGITQVEEMGTIETPIVLTNTLSVPAAAEAVIEYTLSRPGNEDVESVNAVVGETNDGYLNDIRGRHVRKEHVLEAIARAAGGPVEEGCVGAGTGTICYGFKGGIGTSSRRLAASRGGWTVGVLVQTNHGGILQVAGLPVGERLKRPGPEGGFGAKPEGSCMIVVATDAPLDSRNLERLARRALLGIARTGGYYSNGSGDYAIAFSTAREVRSPHRSGSATRTVVLLRDSEMSPLFLAAAEASEEAILNSLFRARRMDGRQGRAVEPLPLDKVRELAGEKRP
ncbi:MAG: aminopeptidase [Candidatus Aminicenantes bacterium RBG_16_63_16]|nr:MAG: aminopeptidase [Candidatus Aminicenantes bacterium RBG_16_63_16]